MKARIMGKIGLDLTQYIYSQACPHCRQRTLVKMFCQDLVISAQHD
jgi:DNA-directed RNA polymerase subunit RPC12/RpoP